MVIAPGTGVGSIQFGMTAEDAKRVLGPPDPSGGTVLQYSALGIAIMTGIGSGTVDAIFLGDPTKVAWTHAFKGRSKEGIGMGSSLEQIVAAYGQPASTTSSPGGAVTVAYDGGKTEYRVKDGKVILIVLRP